MRRLIFLSVLFLFACSSIKVPDDFVYKEIKTRTFTLASWQKITQPQGVYKIYIEGDGYAFNAYGKPTQDPTPRGALLREIAFADPSPNVVYLLSYHTGCKQSSSIIATRMEKGS